VNLDIFENSVNGTYFVISTPFAIDYKLIYWCKRHLKYACDFSIMVIIFHWKYVCVTGYLGHFSKTFPVDYIW